MSGTTSTQQTSVNAGMADGWRQEVLDLTAPVVFFPVRHHSPACARAVAALARRLKPSVILIEGPADFNDHLPELALSHELPIAIYSYAVREDGGRSGAYYPFCVYSPEWQAIQAAKGLAIPYRFIDIPWAEMVPGAGSEEALPQRYADGELRRSDFVAALCEKLGVEGFDTLWDTLFEIEPELAPETVFERCHRFCFTLRAGDSHVPSSDLRREAYMAERIQEALDGRGRKAGPVLVVTGGFHSHALHDRLANHDFTAPDGLPVSHPTERGIALTPYSYERLDNMKGYEAGMPSPGFYDLMWENSVVPPQPSRREGEERQNSEQAYRDLLAKVVLSLRQRKQIVSTADLIAVEAMANGLATLRAHSRVWRTDLIDGIRAALVKDEIEGESLHPFLAALYDVFRGDRRGRLSDGTSLPPLVRDIRRQLDTLDLMPATAERTVSLDLLSESDRERSRLLHRMRVLGIPGFRRTAGTDFAARADLTRLWEEWRIVWGPEFEGGCIEASIFGATLVDAVAAKLLERARSVERNAEAAALAMLDAAVSGISDVARELGARLTTLIREEGSFVRATRALRHLLYLYRYDEALATAGSHSVGALLLEAFERSVWLLETLGQGSGDDKETVDGIATLVEVFERAAAALRLEPPALVDILARVSTETAQKPIVRGAAAGGLWNLQATDMSRLLEQASFFRDPADLGDFLTGLFTLARETVQRQPELLLLVDDTIIALTDGDYLEALPSLRLAFSFFTPREKHYMARTLMDARGDKTAAPLQALEVDIATAARALGIEGQIYDTLRRYGLRGGGTP